MGCVVRQTREWIFSIFAVADRFLVHMSQLNGAHILTLTFKILSHYLSH